ncbi:hypothetical protein CC78DRAFT_335486 [Lojkania enalia]|uniref:Uncharacterized protein n=1 Tax=Lojkania enalia TaxID=147567 RepID=A0A9P4N9D9_9PLEO|nr:hypothetical protein CC78DRAFT_335486 [Didymosphaeria enalia]
MLPSAQLLTAPTSLANYKPDDLSSTALSLLSSSILFLQVDGDLTQEDRCMAQAHPRPSSRNRANDGELWFSLPSGARSEEGHSRPEPSAYRATSSRHSNQRSASPNRFPSIPLISTTSELNKPLPPSPGLAAKKRKPAALRSLIRRRPSGHLDPSHLQPSPSSYSHQRSSSANRNLTPEPSYYDYQSSRSMPSSPAEFSQAYSQVPSMVRAHSAAANYAEPSQPPSTQQHSDSMSSFDPQPPRLRRTFPEASTPASATAADASTDRHRPSSWMSPTEPFQNESDFHLFAEATAGLPDGVGFDTLSPTSPPRLQGSLFSRGRQNDIIPIPLQNSSAGQRSASNPSHPVSGWQNLDYNYYPTPPGNSSLVSSSALPRRESYTQPQISPRLNAINLELERLGLSDEDDPEDELPDYAQSQAEMSAKRRQEATARARELEARWNNSRSWRSR